MTNWETINWNNLLADTKSGDLKAQNSLLRELKVRLSPILQYRLWGWPEQDLQDILQETLIAFLQRLRLDNISDNPQKYALIILRNKIGDALRSKKHRIETIQPSEEWERMKETVSGLDSDLEQQLASNIDRAKLIDALVQVIEEMKGFCRQHFLAFLKGQVKLYEFFITSEPDLKREAFDTRTSRCRSELKSRMFKKIEMLGI